MTPHRWTGESIALPAALRRAHSAVGGHVSRGDSRERQGEPRASFTDFMLFDDASAVQYAIPIARIARCRAEAYDDELGQKLWAALEEAVKEQ